MKKVFVFLLLFCASSVFAQKLPKPEVFAGYQYINYDTKGDDGRYNLNGWNFDVAAPVMKNVSVVADISGGYKSESASSDDISGTGNLHVYNYLFGPRVSVTKGKIKPFAEALFGVAHTTVSASAMGLTVSESSNGFGMALGGGVDLNVNKHFAIRAAKLDYLMNKLSNGDLDVHESLNNLRLATGVVFKF